MDQQECPKDRSFYPSVREFECSIQKQNHPQFSESELEAIQKIKNSLHEPNAYPENINKHLQELIQQSFQNNQFENVRFQSFRNARISAICSTEGIPLDVISFILNRNPQGSCWIIRDAKVSDTCSKVGIPFDDVSFILESGNHLDGASSVSAVKSEIRQVSHLDMSNVNGHRDGSQAAIHPPISTNTTDSFAGPSGISECPSEKKHSSSKLKKFIVFRKLPEHSLIHTVETPFRCKSCGMEFSTKGNLNDHLRYFKGKNPFVCGLCKMAFSHICGFEVHRQSHSQFVPLKCDFCEKMFVTVKILQAHRKSHNVSR